MIAPTPSTDFIYLDIETRDGFQHEHIARLPKTERLNAIRFGLGVTLRAPLQEGYQVWLYKSIEKSGYDLHNYLWNAGATVVGWNVKDFDLPIIHNAATMEGGRVRDYSFYPFPILDLFDSIRALTGRWYKLGVVLESTLGITKAEPGSVVCDMLNSGTAADLQAVADYCIKDVEALMRLHQHLLKGNSLTLPVRSDRNNEKQDLAYYCDPLPRVEVIK